MKRPVGEQVELRDFLGQAQRLVPGRHQHAGAEREIREARGDVGEEGQRVGGREVVREMMLDHPGRPVAGPVGEVAVRQDLLVERGVGEPALAHRRRHEGKVDAA